MNSWWVGVPAAEAVIDCGCEPHRLCWARGELLAPDHAHLEPDEVLAVLRDERCVCAEVLRAWRRHSDNLQVLAVGGREPCDGLGGAGWTRDPGGLAHSRVAAWLGVVGRGRPGDARATDADLVMLLGLGGDLPRRLAAAVAAAWIQRLRGGATLPAGAVAQLHAALYGRVLRALCRWLGLEQVPLELRVIGEQQVPTMMRADDGSVLVCLALGWLLDVWAKGFAIVDERFCLAASASEGHGLHLTAAARNMSAPESLTLELAPAP